MRILIGTTNPSKVKWIASLLEGCDVEFLTLKDLNITDVAQLVGYDDYAYFSRVFKRIEGKSPRAYREEEVR